MKANVPFPDPPRRILPSPLRRAAFSVLGWLAVAVRAATARRRSRLAAAAAAEGGVGGRRICIVEPFGMGDALLLQPLVDSWLAAGARVALAVKPQWFPLFERRTGFERVPFSPNWASEDPAKKGWRLFRDLRDAAAALRGAACGAECIDPRGDPRSILALYLAGAARVRSLPAYWSATDCRLPPGAAHFVPLDRFASRREVSRAFAPVGVPYGRVRLPPRRSAGAAFPDCAGAIGLLPLTPWVGKRWPVSCWTALRAELRRRGCKVAVLCGPGERDAAASAVGSVGAGAAALSVVEAADAADWPEMLSPLAALVTVNTGPMHVADALDVPLVVIDGASRLPLWAPEGEAAFVLHRQDLDPRVPCHPTADNGEGVQRATTAKISAADAVAALESVGAFDRAAFPKPAQCPGPPRRGGDSEAKSLPETAPPCPHADFNPARSGG